MARGDHTAGSDIDLLVDFPADITLFGTAAFKRELRGLLGVDVDVVSARALLPRDRDVVEDAQAL